MTESAAAATTRPGPPPQPGLWTLLSPKWRTAMARVRQERDILKKALAYFANEKR